MISDQQRITQCIWFGLRPHANFTSFVGKTSDTLVTLYAKMLEINVKDARKKM
jgi:hypothetical protein